ncbi:hypothetical protein [Dyella sp. C9]|uniref:hypothetical protein n=1 Tax=Dyella sp. C9 TaxID=2202154 RepID=UPI0013004F8D|nr:hypothetical protein [Dyella sp. C9]
MNNTPKPMSVEAIHSIYAGKKVSPSVAQAKEFQSTNSFARDPLHPGHAPQQPKIEKGPFRR